MTKQIELSQGKVALVDDSDYQEINAHKWHAHFTGWSWYAGTRIDKKTIGMHSLITGFTKTDHIDGDGLNNKRNNLRYATTAQNAWNRKKQKTKSTSQFKGVWWNKEKENWQSAIRFFGKRIFIGGFDSEIEAAEHYDAMAKKLFGAFAKTNF